MIGMDVWHWFSQDFANSFLTFRSVSVETGPALSCVDIAHVYSFYFHNVAGFNNKILQCWFWKMTSRPVSEKQCWEDKLLYQEKSDSSTQQTCMFQAVSSQEVFNFKKLHFIYIFRAWGRICMPQCTHEGQRITCVRWLSAATQWILRTELESKGLAVHNFIHGAISLAQFFIFIVFLFHFALYFCLIFCFITISIILLLWYFHMWIFWILVVDTVHYHLPSHVCPETFLSNKPPLNFASYLLTHGV